MSLDQLFWLGLFLLTLVTLISFFWVIAPYFPTRKGHLALVVKAANLKPGEKLYELGCGDGRVSIALAKAYPESHIIGLELAGPLFFWAWVKAKLSGCKNLTIKWKNIFWQDLGDADAVYVFGMTDSLNQKLKAKFLKEMKPGSRIISYVFRMKTWPGKTETYTGNLSEHDETKISVYFLPEKS